MEKKTLTQYIDHYYNEWGCNCCETTLHAANDAWNLELPETSFKLAGGFGGGCGCGDLCGAVVGGIQALGCLLTEGKTAHKNQELRTRSGMLVKLVEERLGSARCDYLHPKYRNDEEHCLPTVRLIADIIEEVRTMPLPEAPEDAPSKGENL